MNENYTAQSQMQKGFRTFVLTLSVSLIIFSVIYYFISDTQVGTDLNSIENEVTVENSVQSAVVSDNSQEQFDTISNQLALDVPVEAEDLEEDTVFGKLTDTPVVVTSRAVLAGSTTSPTTVGATSPKTKTTTAAAVPNGGITQLTWGFFISLMSFALGFVVISKDPRKMAIEHFEKKMLR